MKTTKEKRLAALLLSLVLSLLMLTACVAGGVPAAGAGTGGENTAEGSPPEEPDGTQTPEAPEKPEVPPAPPEPPPPPEPPEATLAVCGDVMSHMPITNYARQEDGTYSYSAIMAAAEPYVSTADFAVANR